MFNRLILSGGGVKGGLYVGMIKYLEDSSVIFEYLNEVVGTSIGALIGLTITLGYTADQLKELFFSIDFEKMKDPALSNLDIGYGFASGDLLNKMIQDIITGKGYSKDITLSELYNQTDISLVTCAYNMNQKRHTFFDRKKYPDIPAFLAVRMSMNIPLLFCVVKYQGDLYIDGGTVCNLPVRYYTEMYPDHLQLQKIMDTTLSVAFEEINYHDNTEINSFDKFLYALLKSTFHTIESKDKDFIKCQGYSLLILKSNLVSTGNFNLSEAQKTEMFNTGFQCTKEYILDLLKKHK